MPATQTDREVILTHPTSNASVKILKFGANVLSWTINGKDQLWLSESSVLDGTKAVRGGIPLVFPVFGKATDGPTARLPQHGFARNHEWEFLGQLTTNSVQFGLGPENLSQQARDQWGFDFTLLYTVTLEENKLVTALEVQNTDNKEWDFQVLFHTYFRIDDITKVQVTGLDGATVVDKIAKSEYVEKSLDSKVTIADNVDRVYQAVSSDPVKVESLDSRVIFELTDRHNVPDMVVWNPWLEKANDMADFSPKDGYQNMICVETGSVAKWTSVKPGNKWVASQTLKANL